jgi:SAM-dependent methyltransferase
LPPEPTIEHNGITRTRERTGGTDMGTGKEQAELWGPGARDWADYNEPMCTPFYNAVLDATGVGNGTTLLDVGCGGGFALLLAAGRGAVVAGLDATQPLLDIAAERVPQATLTAGDLEDPLPFDSGSFDVVTAFNAVQYAADPVAVLVNMRKVTRSGGMLGVVVWGPPAQCESGVLFAELGPLMPPAPQDAPKAVAWSEEGELERLASAAGLEPVAVSDVANPLLYPDLATAVRTQLSSGPARAAIGHSGLAATRGGLTRAFAGSRKPDGTYRQDNVFRYLVARA